MAKLAIFASVLTGLTELVGQTAAYFAMLAAGLAGIGWIYKHVLGPAAKSAKRVLRAVGVLEELPEFMAENRVRSERVSERLDLLERHVGVFAAEDAAKVRQAMSGAAPDLSA